MAKRIASSPEIDELKAKLKVQNVEHKRSLNVQKALYKIADAASAARDMPSFYKKVHKIVGGLMYAENFFVALYDAQSDLITWPYYVDTMDLEPLPPTKLSNFQGATGWVLRYGKTIATTDGSWAAAKDRGEADVVGTPSNGIATPLKVGNKILGVLFIQSYIEEFGYRPEDIKVLEFVARHISIALMRIRAIEETRQRNAELKIINSIQQGLASDLDLQGIYNLVGNKIQEIFKADTTYIVSYDRKKKFVYSHYYVERGKSLPPQELSFGQGAYSKVINFRKPILLGSQQEWSKVDSVIVNSPGYDRELNESFLGVPILLGDEVTGVVSIQSYKRYAYSENDVRLLTTNCQRHERSIAECTILQG